MDLDETWNISEGQGAHSHKNRGNCPQNFYLRMPCQNVFCFLSPIQHGLSATYPAPILSIFEIKDVNRYEHA